MSLNKKLFLVLWSAGTLSVLAVLPYAFYVQQNLLKDIPFSLPALVLLSLLQGSLYLAVATSLGLFFARKVGFTFPILERALAGSGPIVGWRQVLPLPVALGLLTGMAIILVDYLFNLAGVTIDAKFVTGAALWKGLLGSFYGGIAEEILLRLFMLSFLVWLFGKLTRRTTPLSNGKLVWTAIAVAAVIFGLGHLPATATYTVLTPLVIVRAIVLNGIGGLVFGWLYWKKGLESAIVAHFSADIIILAIWPMIVG